jgi:hypothetical protein
LESFYVDRHRRLSFAPSWLANQSKAGRHVRQLGKLGRAIWDGVKARQKSATKSN